MGSIPILAIGLCRPVTSVFQAGAKVGTFVLPYYTLSYRLGANLSKGVYYGFFFKKTTWLWTSHAPHRTETMWPNGQGVWLRIRRLRVRVPSWLLPSKQCFFLWQITAVLTGQRSKHLVWLWQWKLRHVCNISKGVLGIFQMTLPGFEVKGKNLVQVPKRKVDSQPNQLKDLLLKLCVHYLIFSEPSHHLLWSTKK